MKKEDIFVSSLNILCCLYTRQSWNADVISNKNHDDFFHIVFLRKLYEQYVSVCKCPRAALTHSLSQVQPYHILNFLLSFTLLLALPIVYLGQVSDFVIRFKSRTMLALNHIFLVFSLPIYRFHLIDQLKQYFCLTEYCWLVIHASKICFNGDNNI